MQVYDHLTRKELIELGDKLWQLVVCHLAVDRCQFNHCGDFALNGAHHTVGRSMFFRFKFEYGLACCPYHHNQIHSKGDQWFFDELVQFNPIMFKRIAIRDRKGITNRQQMEADIGTLEFYCRENGLYPAD